MSATDAKSPMFTSFSPTNNTNKNINTNISPTPSTSYPKSQIRILLLEKIHQSAIDVFVNEGFQVETMESLSESELCEKIGNYHAIGVRSKTKLTPNVLQYARRLLVIGCFCIGTDQTDLEKASLVGTAVFNAPFANTRSVAELMIGELIALARQLPERSAEAHAKVWNKVSKSCYEVRGKTLAIIGYGHVGTQVSILAEAMGMRVQFYDILPSLALGNAVKKDTLQAALENADFVSLHVPGTPQTDKLIDAEQIKMMKKGAYLLNASRGNVVNLDALKDALLSKHLAGAAVDVFPYEPAEKEEPFECCLQGVPNVILTPHIGGSTEEAQVAIGEEVATKMVSFINSGQTVGSVNLPEMQLQMNPETHRILNIHSNVPGVLRDINTVLGDYNVVSQILMTKGKVGYMIIDVDKGMSHEVKSKISELKSSIRTRILY